jgi:hypothetical protein
MHRMRHFLVYSLRWFEVGWVWKASAKGLEHRIYYMEHMAAPGISRASGHPLVLNLSLLRES